MVAPSIIVIVVERLMPGNSGGLHLERCLANTAAVSVKTRMTASVQMISGDYEVYDGISCRHLTDQVSHVAYWDEMDL